MSYCITSFLLSGIFILSILFCFGWRTNKPIPTKEALVTTRSVIETEKDGIIKFPAKENSEYVLTQLAM